MASAPAPANATNSTGDGVDNEAGAQPGANVGGVNYGGGLISQDYGYGGGGGGGSAGQTDIVQGGSPVFPGGVQSFQVRAHLEAAHAPDPCIMLGNGRGLARLCLLYGFAGIMTFLCVRQRT